MTTEFAPRPFHISPATRVDGGTSADVLRGEVVPELQNTPTNVGDSVSEPLVTETELESESKSPQWVSRRKLLGRVALGLGVAGSIGYSLTNTPLEEITHRALEYAPWAAGGIITTEGLFMGGMVMALAGAGQHLRKGEGTKRERFAKLLKNDEADVRRNKLVQAGLAVNTIGAIGSAALIGAGGALVMPESLPAVGLAVAADVASTLALRAPFYRRRVPSANNAKAESKKEHSAAHVRTAREEDIDRLVDIDLEAFDSSYGEAAPDRSEVTEMFRRRLANAGRWMVVVEKDGQVEGFATAFRTDKPVDQFVSWEESTNNGTLDDRVNPEGKYAYVANMTVNREAGVSSAMDALLLSLMANVIEEGGVEHAYFEARMPGFAEWAATKQDTSNSDIHALAREYADSRREDGKRIDWQLRMYEGLGYELRRLVPDAFSDAASLDYGALFKAAIPAVARAPRPVRQAAAGVMRFVSRHPRILDVIDKVL